MKVLFVDDHDLVRDTLAAYLRAEGGVEVETAGNLHEGLDRLTTSGAFDLVLLDYNMPGMDGLVGLSRMIEANAGKPVAIVSGASVPDLAQDAIRAGAAGFVPKTLPARSMVAAIRFMIAGEVYLPFASANPAGDPKRPDLTKREWEVLRGICEGKSNKQIAMDHDLQEVTVKLHVKTLSRKLGARNRTHAAMIARNRDLI